MKSLGKNLFVWVGILFTITVLYGAFQDDNMAKGKAIDFSDFLQEVESGNVAAVNIKDKLIEGKRGDGSDFVTHAPSYPNLIDTLRSKDVRISVAPGDEELGMFWSIIISWFPIFLLIGVYVFFMRQMQGGGRGGGGALGFGKSRARMLNEDRQKATFKDVAGVDEAKDDLYEIVDFLKNPQKYQALGGKIPKGCLLVGPPGTGKTLLARAVAGEASVPFFTISGSDFVEMFVGVGASRVRDMFEQGKRNAPCLIFIDEIDAVGRHRGAGHGGGNDEREQTLNQLLVEMDGFESHEGVILIAATNRPDVLDPALLRPGRFDRQIIVPVPDISGREQILNVHIAKVPIGPDVDARVLARGTPGFSGADLANLINEAALLAARNGRKVVTMKELEDAKDKVMMGAERRSLVMTEEEKKLTAYHEAGHAIVAVHCPASDPIHKATIIPRGRALGLVMRLPEGDRVSMTREKLEADLAVAMGGRIAEEYIFGYDKVTSGASSDIKQATGMARAMVTEWGMSDKVGPLDHSSEQQEVFLGRSLGQQKTMSEATANLIDQEVKRIVELAYDRAKKLLKKHDKQLHALAEGLLEYETLSGSDITELLAGKFNPEKKNEKNKAKAGAKSVLPSRKKKVSTTKESKKSSSTKKKDDDKS